MAPLWLLRSCEGDPENGAQPHGSKRLPHSPPFNETADRERKGEGGCECVGAVERGGRGDHRQRTFHRRRFQLKLKHWNEPIQSYSTSIMDKEIGWRESSIEREREREMHVGHSETMVRRISPLPTLTDEESCLKGHRYICIGSLFQLMGYCCSRLFQICVPQQKPHLINQESLQISEMAKDRRELAQSIEMGPFPLSLPPCVRFMPPLFHLSSSTEAEKA
ncbi:hypothetical protein JZ751_023086 [Albula glossodonta]|uniref:Uncharacterized protein n=1 Tax=Albula glossodonta TaxID=121402 RepID=A0A8T2PH23_9TELE|nr:hypothetical protein JZ751_023086 [Albula glossodonta]